MAKNVSDTKNEKKVEKNYKKNYIILGLIFIVCIGLILYLRQWYKVYDEYQKESPVIRGVLQEIVPDDLEHYIMENPTSIIYMCTAQDEICRDFEKDFKKYINKKEYNDTIIYLNLSDVDSHIFVENFNNKYNYKKKLTEKYPAIVIFRDGNVDGLLQENEKNKITISKIDTFLELNRIEEGE